MKNGGPGCCGEIVAARWNANWAAGLMNPPLCPTRALPSATHRSASFGFWRSAVRSTCAAAPNWFWRLSPSATISQLCPEPNALPIAWRWAISAASAVPAFSTGGLGAPGCPGEPWSA